MNPSPSLFSESFFAIVHILLFPGGIFALILGCCLFGLDAKVTARLQRRIGGSLFQPFYDVIKLLNKQWTPPNHFKKSLYISLPILTLLVYSIGSSLIPIAGLYGGTPFKDDVLFFLCLLYLPTCILLATHSVSKSPFAKILLKKELANTCAYVIPLTLIMVCVGWYTGQGTTLVLSFTQIFQYQQEHGQFAFNLVLLPAFISFLLALPAAIESTPFAPSEGEKESLGGLLEEYSGVFLGIFSLSRALKLIALLGFGITLFLPSAPMHGALFGLFWFIVKCCLIVLLAVTLIKAAVGSFRIGQVYSFCIKGPIALALCSLLLVWLTI